MRWTACRSNTAAMTTTTVPTRVVITAMKNPNSLGSRAG